MVMRNGNLINKCNLINDLICSWCDKKGKMHGTYNNVLD